MPQEIRYPRPPLVESACRIVFANDSPWDLSMFGEIRNKLASLLPRQQSMQAFEASLSLGGSGAQQRVNREDQLKLSSEDERSFVFLRRNVLSVHRTAPYPGWDAFFPQIRASLQAYLEVAAPRVVTQLNMDYVNEIPMPSDPVDLGHWFELYPRYGAHFSETRSRHFHLLTQFPAGTRGDIIQISMASTVSEATPSIRLQLGIASNASDTSPPYEALDWFTQAHSALEDAFEGCVKDSLRDQWR